MNALPGGVYGFTYSPALPNAPLFADRRYRSYETHKLAERAKCSSSALPRRRTPALIESAIEDVTIQIQPQPEDGCTTLVRSPTHASGIIVSTRRRTSTASR